MNRECNSRVLSKHSERLLKNLKNTTGDYFFAAPCMSGATVQLPGYNEMLFRVSRARDTTRIQKMSTYVRHQNWYRYV